MGEVRQRQVARVDGVHVEMDDQPLGLPQRGEGAAGAASRVGAHRVVGIAGHGRVLVEDRLAVGLGIGLVVPEHGQASLSQRRPAVEQAGQLGLGQPEQVGDAHGIEDPAAVLGRAEIGVAVEVGEAGAGPDPLQAGQDTQGDGAVPAEHEHQRTVPRRGLHPVRDRSRHPDGGGQVTSARVPRVDAEGLADDVPVVGHGYPGPDEALDEARRPHCVRCSFLARVVRARAGRRADDRDRAHGRHRLRSIAAAPTTTPALTIRITTEIQRAVWKPP